MDKDRQERFADRALWVIYPSMLLACVYYLFIAPASSAPKKISALAYGGPVDCPTTMNVRVALTEDGCFSPRTLIKDGESLGIRYLSEGYRAGPPAYRGFYRIGADAVVVTCYIDKFFDTNTSGNGCFIRGIERNIFVVRNSEGQS